MLKKLVLTLTLTTVLFSFNKNVPSGTIMGTESCPVCNMKVKKFYKTSHAVKYKNNQKEHFCSMHCISKTLKKRKDIKSIYVVDANSNKLINAKTATYVIGSSIPSTMGGKSKIAFSSKSAAKVFQKKHGGTIGSYTEALE